MNKRAVILQSGRGTKGIPHESIDIVKNILNSMGLEYKTVYSTGESKHTHPRGLPYLKLQYGLVFLIEMISDEQLTILTDMSDAIVVSGTYITKAKVEN